MLSVLRKVLLCEHACHGRRFAELVCGIQSLITHWDGIHVDRDEYEPDESGTGSTGTGW